jgi:hypothetical protein
MPFVITSVLTYRADPKMQMKIGTSTALVGLYLRFFQKGDHLEVKYGNDISYYVCAWEGGGVVHEV